MDVKKIKDEIKKDLDYILNEEIQIRMYFYTKHKTLVTPQLINSTFENIGKAYIKNLIDLVNSFESIKNYDLDGNLTTELAYIKSSKMDIQDYSELSILLSGDTSSVLEEKQVNKFYSSIKAVIFIINDKLTIIKRFVFPKRLLRNNILNFKKYPLKQIEEDIFSIDNRIDVFELSGNIYIANNYSFECIFDLKSQYEEKLKKSIYLLEEAKLINQVDDFKKECLNNKLYTKRLLKLIQKNNFDILKNKKDKMKEVIENYDLNIKLTKDKIIDFSTDGDVGQILNLLGDNYYISAILEEKRLARISEEASEEK